jgi:hypothetical protein
LCIHTDSTGSEAGWFPASVPFGNYTVAIALNFIAINTCDFEWGSPMDARNPNSSEPRPVKTTNEARQGVTGQNVNVVLVVALTAIVIIFALLWFFYFGR